MPHSNLLKDELVKVTFYAVKLGLEVLPTEYDEDKNRIKTQVDKLKIDEYLRLPHPSTLKNWTRDIMKFPLTTETFIAEYFDQCNFEACVLTGGKKALKDRKSFLISEHVSDVRYHDVSHHHS